MLRMGDSGADVQLLQYTLQLLGYNPGNIDGNFGEMTFRAVREFQKEQGLIADGVVGPETYSGILPYYFGYKQYNVRIGDTVKSISEKFGTTPQAILLANPSIEPTNLVLGTRLIIPYGFDVVKTNVPYTYQVLYYDINGLKARYPFIKVDAIGSSVNGNKIFRVRLGEGDKYVTYNSSHHANEWITTPVLMKWIEEFLKAYVRNTSIKGYNVVDIWKKCTIDIIPMVNIDGVDLVINGAKPQGKKAAQLIEWNFGSEDFSDWKANINGVDLDRNYDAAWEEYKELEEQFGITGPAPALYSGEVPESQPEVKAMVKFTRSNPYRLALCYQTQGQIIYWNFQNLQPPESILIGEQFSKVSGYTLAKPNMSESYAAYKDWFIKEFSKPGYAILCGNGKEPLPLEQFGIIYDNNEELLLLATVL